MLSASDNERDGCHPSSPDSSLDSQASQKFTGQVRDEETRLDYFGARYYSAPEGRFLSPDAPFLDQDEYSPQSWNLYAYVRNNPTRFIDPTGECVQSSDADDSTSARDICRDVEKLDVDAQGRRFIQFSETERGIPRLEVYPDPGAQRFATVGYGHKVVPDDGLKIGSIISRDRSEKFFEADLATAEGGLRVLVQELPLSQNEFNALSDLVYNVGLPALSPTESPRLNRAVRAGDYLARGYPFNRS